MWQGVAEAIVNLTLSISLTLAFGSIIGVALGSVIPTVLFGWGLLWGWAAKEAQLTRRALFARVVLPAWKASLPLIAAALALRYQPWWASGSTTLLVLIEGCFLGLVALAGVWRFGLTPADRQRVEGKLPGRFRRRPAPSPS